MEKIVFTVDQACEFLEMGKTMLYETMKQRGIKFRKYGRKTIFLKSDLTDFLAKLPEAEFDEPDE